MHETSVTLKPEISNENFLHAIFGAHYSYAHVTSFMQDPSNIAHGESGHCWAGGAYKDTPLIPNSNQFYTVSLFVPDDAGRSRRRKANFSATFVIGLDDVKEKLPIEQVLKLPPPSIVIKSSLHSEQWLYLLETPETSISRIDNLHDGLIKNGLAPDGKDPGQKSVARYLRLPEGYNTKAKRIEENKGIPPRCQITEWHPERRYTLQQLAKPFGVDLDAQRADKRIDGAAHISDHPLLHTDAIEIKSMISDGRYSVVCPWVDEHTDNDDSGSAFFLNADGSIGFKCHHGACQERTGRDLLNYIEQHNQGFNDTLKNWQVMREFAAVTPQINSPVKTILTSESPSDMLRSLCLNGKSKTMESQMLADKFILKDIAILGHWTVFYAGPNTGKTLLTLWLIREAVTANVISGEDIFYANFDDTYSGLIQKLKIAENTGFNMISDSGGFKADSLLSFIKDMIDKNDATGKVIILDTLKKFTDLMDKRLSSEFGKIARSFISAGGSLICLAHTNKHRGADGKSIYAGTSDIRDDADCCYTIENINENADTHTVQFECTKSRGDVSQIINFQYTKKKGAGYQALFNSVKRVSKDVAESVQQVALQDDERKKDADAIEQIKCAIANGQITKTTIETFVVSMSDVSHRRTRSILSKYESQLWSVEKGSNNASVYSLIVAPSPSVSFL